jgi:ABC-type sugar transport system ATPase subunit
VTVTVDDALRCESIDKSFPGVRALDRVSVAVRRGSVHALLGENGAGKSTLIKIMTGAERPDRGRVLIGGRPLRQHTPSAAQRLGVRVVHQERQIAGDLSVAHNVLLDSLPRNRLGLVSTRGLVAAAQRQLDVLGVDIDARARAGALSPARQQLVELARAVSLRAAVVVLDEPTASLAGDEVVTLFRVIRELRAAGTSLVYISHHLHEVFEVADTATVLRNGRHVLDVPVADTDADSLLRAMFGRDVAHARLPRAPRPDPARPALVAAGVSLAGTLAPTDLIVHSGEVIALCGPAGSGASELAEILAGVRAPDTGSVLVGDGRPVGSRSRAARRGIGVVPADRKRDGLLLDRSVIENLGLGSGSGLSRWIYRPAAARRAAVGALSRGKVRVASPSAPVRLLSGGNQQRVIISRWLLTGCRVLVLDQPTSGVDVAAKFDIYAQLLELTAEGVAVVVVSSDYEEICSLADRVLVLRGGAVMARVDGGAVSPDSLYELEAGSRAEET